MMESILSEPGTSQSSPSDTIFETTSSKDDSHDTGITVDDDMVDDPATSPTEFCTSEDTSVGNLRLAADEFFFETDHPALKENTDYRKLLHTVLVLEAERARAIQDLDKLYECRDRALADPFDFVEKLQRGEDLGLPKPQMIPEIPAIDWTKYSLSNIDISTSKRQLTRQSTKAAADIFGMLSKPEGRNKERKSRSEQGKSSKFNQPWSVEEQKRLEALLIDYPPEEIETRRWEKIAAALGNRTTTQVASRVQKYFIKLMKAGMPIPGRQPNSCYLRKPRRQVIRQQPSTFLVSHALPVFISEEDEETYSSNGCSRQPSIGDSSSDIDFSDEESIDPELRNSAEYQELLNIKKAINDKQQSLVLAQHIGFKCAHCEFEPIIGVRWHCTECPVSQSVDFCEDCVNSNREIKSHSLSHRLEAIHKSSSAVVDRDYMHFACSDNYLDPNYIPAM